MTDRGLKYVDTNSKTWIRALIDNYKQEVCLWKRIHPDFPNSNARGQAFDRLAERMKKLNPNADHASVQRKIRTLRSSFLRVYRKTTSQSNNKTQLWYYDRLSFIVNQNSKSVLADTDNDDASSYEHEQENETSEEPKQAQAACTGQAHNQQKQAQQPKTQQTLAGKFLESTDSNLYAQRKVPQSVNFHQQQQPNEHTTAQRTQIQTDQIARKHLQPLFVHSPTSSTAASHTSTRQQEMGVFIILVDQKLRCLNPMQRILAERLISDILYDAELGNLSPEQT